MIPGATELAWEAFVIVGSSVKNNTFAHAITCISFHSGIDYDAHSYKDKVFTQEHIYGLLLCTYRWSSFYRGGSVAFYMTLYALGFLMSTMSKLDGFIPVVIYLSYMSIIITGFYFAMGTIGFGASAW